MPFIVKKLQIPCTRKITKKPKGPRTCSSCKGLIIKGGGINHSICHLPKRVFVIKTVDIAASASLPVKEEIKKE